jgi:glycerol dehydrogenase
MSLKIMIAPRKYIQGPNALTQIGVQLEVLGMKNPLVLASPSAWNSVKDIVTEGLDAKGIQYAFTEFGRECTWKEIERVKGVCLAGGHDALVSCGGGKTLDAGRCAAAGAAVDVGVVPPRPIEQLGADIHCIQVPTIAATDAPTSSVSVIYTEQGINQTAVLLPSNPSIVFVDTVIIAQAPVRFLVSGMGDALATYFEADASYRTATPCMITGGLATRATRALARLSFDLLLEYGVEAKLEAEIGVPGPGLEAVVEANILLSGLGFECGGLSAAHAIGHAFTHIPESFEVDPLHGEMVGFGTLAQLMLEEREPKFLDEIFGFCKSVGLPTTFDEMGMKNVTEEVLNKAADDASKDFMMMSMPKGSTTPNEEGRFYDPIEILNCLKATDAYGRAFSR